MRGRRKTDAYKLWCKTAQQYMLAHPKPLPTFLGRVSLVIFFGEVDAMAKDENNCTKGPIDFLVKEGVIPDDSGTHIRGTQTFWVKNMRGTLIAFREDPEEPRASDLRKLVPPSLQELSG